MRLIDEATITIELSHKSHEFIKISITVSNGTAESADYEVMVCPATVN